MKKKILLLLIAFTCLIAQAQIPNGYYDNANGKTGTELRAALHDIIDNHTSISYQQLWSAFWTTDNKGNNVVWDMYSDGAPYTYNYNGNDQCGEYGQEGDCFNREHSWPQSWFNNASTPTTDLHHIFPTDGFVNSQRSNYPFGEVSNATWTSQNGSKLGNCKNSLGYTGKVFEPIDEYKGDFARAYFYMSTRYYGEDSDWGTSGMTDKADIKPWAIAMLLNWSDNDPVSQKEIDRNNAVYGIQGNRNPFIDHPEYAHIIWEEGWSGVTYNITCAAVQHGSIIAPATAVEGTMVSLAAMPAQGYMLNSWNVYKTNDANTIVAVSDNGIFTMPAFNVTVSATFVQNSTYYTLTKGAVSHGNFTMSATSALSGSTITLTASPDNGYVLYDWYVYKTSDIDTHVDVSKSGNNGTFTMPAFNVTVTASFAQGSAGNYEKVTESLSDWSGEYLIVYENGGKAFNGGLNTLDATNNYITVTINGNSIESNATTDAARFTMATMSGGYSIKSASGKYIGNGSNSNGLTSSDSPMVNSLAYHESGTDIIGSGGAYLRYNAAANQERFRYFKSSTYSSQQPIHLYRKTATASSTPTHTIQFHPNGATGSGYTQMVNEFEPTALQPNTFSRSGFAFDSWNTATDGTGTTYFDGAIVTLLNDLTLYAQWNPVYSITISDNIANGSVSVSANEAVEGATISLTATPASEYELDAWIVTTENNETVTVQNNQFEMPASNVTVSANFVYVGQAFERHYYKITSIDQLVAGRTYLMVNTSAGKAMSTSQNSNNRGAVGVSISNGCIASIGNTVCELTLGGSAGAWTFYDPNWNNTGGYLYAASSGSNYLKTQATNDANGQWSITLASNGSATIVAQGSNTRNHLRYNPNSGNPIFSCYANTSNLAKVELYVRSEEYEYAEDATLACLNTFDKHTVLAGATLTANTVLGMSQCNSPSQIIIEDGAQLIHPNDGVKATFKKSITGYEGNSGWYTLAVPFADYDLDDELNTNQHDLYAYDESADLEWINHKSNASNFTVNPSSGYLYAHSPSTTLRMTGTLVNGDYSETVALSHANTDANLRGYHLLGNPTAHPITFTKSDQVSDGYYYLNNSDSWIYEPDNTVPAGRGFLVKANAEGQSVTLNSDAKRSAEALPILKIDIDGEQVYVKCSEGVNMPLLNFKGTHPCVYLSRDGQPYVMLVSDNASDIDLCFLPKHDGQHRLSVTLDGMNVEYLHLIDRLTGADINLLETPNYHFESSHGDHAKRFQLVFKAEKD